VLNYSFANDTGFKHRENAAHLVNSASEIVLLPQFTDYRVSKQPIDSEYTDVGQS